MTKAKKKIMEEYLDKKWDIIAYDLDNKANVSYYKGIIVSYYEEIIKTVELMESSWERKNSKHTIY